MRRVPLAAPPCAGRIRSRSSHASPSPAGRAAHGRDPCCIAHHRPCVRPAHRRRRQRPAQGRRGRHPRQHRPGPCGRRRLPRSPRRGDQRRRLAAGGPARPLDQCRRRRLRPALDPRPRRRPPAHPPRWRRHHRLLPQPHEPGAVLRGAVGCRPHRGVPGHHPGLAGRRLDRRQHRRRAQPAQLRGCGGGHRAVRRTGDVLPQQWRRPRRECLADHRQRAPQPALHRRHRACGQLPRGGRVQGLRLHRPRGPHAGQGRGGLDRLRFP